MEGHHSPVSLKLSVQDCVQVRNLSKTPLAWGLWGGVSLWLMCHSVNSLLNSSVVNSGPLSLRISTGSPISGGFPAEHHRYWLLFCPSVGLRMDTLNGDTKQLSMPHQHSQQPTTILGQAETLVGVRLEFLEFIHVATMDEFESLVCPYPSSKLDLWRFRATSFCLHGATPCANRSHHELARVPMSSCHSWTQLALSIFVAVTLLCCRPVSTSLVTQSKFRKLVPMVAVTAVALSGTQTLPKYHTTPVWDIFKIFSGLIFISEYLPILKPLKVKENSILPGQKRVQTGFPPSGSWYPSYSKN